MEFGLVVLLQSIISARDVKAEIGQAGTTFICVGVRIADHEIVWVDGACGPLVWPRRGSVRINLNQVAIEATVVFAGCGVVVPDGYVVNDEWTVKA